MDNEELLIPISPGELIDKLTVLQLKIERLNDDNKLSNVLIEHKKLSEIWNNSSYSKHNISEEWKSIYETNSELWDIIGSMHDKTKSFTDKDYAAIAKRECELNDIRILAKRKINSKLNSGFVEEKSYING